MHLVGLLTCFGILAVGCLTPRRAPDDAVGQSMLALVAIVPGFVFLVLALICAFRSWGDEELHGGKMFLVTTAVEATVVWLAWRLMERAFS